MGIELDSRNWVRAPVRRSRPRLFLIVISLIIFASFLYSQFEWTQPPAPAWYHDDTPAQVAAKTTKDLRGMLQTVMKTSDLAGMGARMGPFAQLIEATAADTSIGQDPLRSLLSQQFPWWKWTRAQYTPWIRHRRTSTGMVMCVSDKTAPAAAQLISTLRNIVNSALPIELAYAGDGDLSPATREILLKVDKDLSFIDLLDIYDDSAVGIRHGGSFMRPFAMLASSFEEVILVDTDVIFLQAPDAVFYQHPSLRASGTLFWHDRAYRPPADFSRRDWVKGLLKEREPSSSLVDSLFWTDDLWQEMDAGVVCMDKSRPAVFMSLVFATWMNSEPVRLDAALETIATDKETYWLAAELSGTSYAFAPNYAGILGTVPSPSQPDQVCGVQMLHRDHYARPLWFKGGLQKNKFHKEPVYEAMTHYIFPNGARMEAQPRWRYDSDGVWWAQPAMGDDMRAISADETQLMERMFDEAKRLDDVFRSSLS